MYRTIQSGYSELLGMLDGLSLVVPKVNTNAYRVPLNVRRTEQISNELLNKAAPDGFITVPIKTYIKARFENDLEWKNCKYVYAVSKTRSSIEDTFKDVLWFKPHLERAFAKNL